MKTFLFILLLFSTNIVSAQFTYNAVDTSYKIKFKEFLIIADTIETLYKYKLKSENHEIRLGLFVDLVKQQDDKIYKLETKDSLCNLELSFARKMDIIQKDNLKTSMDIISSYQSTIAVKDHELGLKNKEIKNERNWKNVYKFGYPIIGTLLALLIITN